MIVPIDKINDEALNKMLEEIILRDEDISLSLSDKIEYTINMLKKGKVFITFDEESETFNIISKEQLYS